MIVGEATKQTRTVEWIEELGRQMKGSALDGGGLFRLASDRGQA